ncbi:MAG: pilus assembly FimT family protein [Peptostreptococcaceae bacterium]
MTLVELVVTITVLVLITTICFPRENINKYQVNSFTKQLCSDIRYVRKSNINGNSSVYVYLKNEDGKSRYILREKGKDVKEVFLPKDSTIKYAREKIIFKKDGSPDPLGTTITVRYKDIKKEITIVPISGRVLLKEGIYET